MVRIESKGTKEGEVEVVQESADGGNLGNKARRREGSMKKAFFQDLCELRGSGKVGNTWQHRQWWHQKYLSVSVDADGGCSMQQMPCFPWHMCFLAYIQTYICVCHQKKKNKLTSNLTPIIDVSFSLIQLDILYLSLLAQQPFNPKRNPFFALHFAFTLIVWLLYNFLSLSNCSSIARPCLSCSSLHLYVRPRNVQVHF